MSENHLKKKEEKDDIEMRSWRRSGSAISPTN